MKPALTLTLSARLTNLELLGPACRAVAVTLLGDETLAARLEIAVIEVCSNIVRHGHPEEPDHHFSVTMAATEGGLEATIRDTGRAFAFDRTEMPSLDVDVADLPEGGFGLPLVHAAMDSVDYAYVDGVNEIRLQLQGA